VPRRVTPLGEDGWRLASHRWPSLLAYLEQVMPILRKRDTVVIGDESAHKVAGYA